MTEREWHAPSLGMTRRDEIVAPAGYADGRVISRAGGGVGLFWGVLSPLGYTATYLCLRAAAVQVDPLVAAFFRAIPLVLAAWTILLRERRVGSAGRTTWPGWGPIWPLVVVGLIFNVTGNGSFQAALVLAGLAVSAPVSGGATLWGSALGGWWLLRERV